MKAKETKTDVGVIVGRFQVHELHEGHRGLIDTVRDKHDKLIMFLLLARLRNTLRTPPRFPGSAADYPYESARSRKARRSMAATC